MVVGAIPLVDIILPVYGFSYIWASVGWKNYL